MSDMSPFEKDIAGQPAALRRWADAATPPELAQLAAASYDRIVLTGMGSSHFAALPTWRRLIAAGLPAWWVDSSQLLDSPELITPGTLLVATSQSGASGEVVALLEADNRPGALIAVTNNPDSPIAAAADAAILLDSGDEATVSTKSYLNTLVAHDRLIATLLKEDPIDLDGVVTAVERFDQQLPVEAVANGLGSRQMPRVAYVGFGDDAATALYAGLITKEGAKVPAEGFIGGQFRHGPLELAGPGLVAVLFGSDRESKHVESLRRLGEDLCAAGTTVVVVGSVSGVEATMHAIPAATGTLPELVHGALLAQHLTVAIARVRGIIPGAFAYGSKVTTAL